MHSRLFHGILRHTNSTMTAVEHALAIAFSTSTGTHQLQPITAQNLRPWCPTLILQHQKQLQFETPSHMQRLFQRGHVRSQLLREMKLHKPHQTLKKTVLVQYIKMRSCKEEQSTSLPPVRPRGPDGGEGSAPRSDGACDAARAAPGTLGSVADAAGGFGR